jgi:hypothetical protein
MLSVALYMRFTYCARIRDTALAKACLDLAITLAGRVLFTTAIPPALRKALQETGDLYDLDEQGF